MLINVANSYMQNLYPCAKSGFLVKGVVHFHARTELRKNTYLKVDKTHPTKNPDYH